MVIEQLDLFAYAEEKEDSRYTENQLNTINKIKTRENVKDVILYDSGIVGVVVGFKPKPITPQGDITCTFTPKWTEKEYFIFKNGDIYFGAAVK